MKNKIAHLTLVHPRFDTRIFFKECSSLAQAGFEVHLVVADGNGDEIRAGVRISDVGKSATRLQRIFSGTAKVLKKARKLDCDVYHLHDPELIPIGLLLKKLGKKVIFDSHEDVATQIRGKTYLCRQVRLLLSFVYSRIEKFACKKIDAVVAATPFIAEKFEKFSNRVVDVNNFPVLSELENDRIWSERKKQVCYIGGLCEVRGLREMIAASSFFARGIILKLAGRFFDMNLENETRELCVGKPVEMMGFLKRPEVKSLLAESQVGLVALHPLENYLDSLPVKMFEYMAAGLPVIASDFPFWQKIIAENACGISVDPLEPEKIARAVNWLLENPQQAEEMGRNGKKAVSQKFNWQNEEKKLLGLYSDLFAS